MDILRRPFFSDPDLCRGALQCGRVCETQNMCDGNCLLIPLSQHVSGQAKHFRRKESLRRVSAFLTMVVAYVDARQTAVSRTLEPLSSSPPSIPLSKNLHHCPIANPIHNLLLPWLLRPCARPPSGWLVPLAGEQMRSIHLKPHHTNQKRQPGTVPKRMIKHNHLPMPSSPQHPQQAPQGLLPLDKTHKQPAPNSYLRNAPHL